jgi:MSHA biogenesis protein MshG
MPSQTRYRYKAVAEDGSLEQGTIAAHSTETVEEFLSSRRLTPIKIAAVQERRPISLFGLLGGTDYEKLIMFTNQLATLHRSGIPLLRSLSLIRIGGPESHFNHVINHIRLNVQAGKSLSEAMSQHTDLFFKAYVATIAAGEESGKLEFTLDELSGMLEREMELGRQLKVATRYPVIVVVVIAAAFVVMMTFVIPRFMAFYDSFGATLPLPTRILMGISHLITGYWPAALGLVAAAGFAFRQLLGNEQGRLWFDRQILRLPFVGDLAIKGNVARFTLMFRMLFRAGLPIVRSVEVLQGTIKNSAIALEIKQMDDLFRKGQDITSSSAQFKYFPAMALQLMGIGLESGSLETMLEDIGVHYSKEVSYRSRQLTAIIEPILTLVLGAFVLLLALAMFLPMWNLIHVFKG